MVHLMARSAALKARHLATVRRPEARRAMEARRALERRSAQMPGALHLVPQVLRLVAVAAARSARVEPQAARLSGQAEAVHSAAPEPQAAQPSGQARAGSDEVAPSAAQVAIQAQDAAAEPDAIRAPDAAVRHEVLQVVREQQGARPVQVVRQEEEVRQVVVAVPVGLLAEVAVPQEALPDAEAAAAALRRVEAVRVVLPEAAERPRAAEEQLWAPPAALLLELQARLALGPR